MELGYSRTTRISKLPNRKIQQVQKICVTTYMKIWFFSTEPIHLEKFRKMNFLTFQPFPSLFILVVHIFMADTIFHYGVCNAGYLINKIWRRALLWKMHCNQQRATFRFVFIKIFLKIFSEFGKVVLARMNGGPDDKKYFALKSLFIKKSTTTAEAVQNTLSERKVAFIIHYVFFFLVHFNLPEWNIWTDKVIKWRKYLLIVLICC